MILCMILCTTLGQCWSMFLVFHHLAYSEGPAPRCLSSGAGWSGGDDRTMHDERAERRAPRPLGDLKIPELLECREETKMCVETMIFFRHWKRHIKIGIGLLPLYIYAKDYIWNVGGSMLWTCNIFFMLPATLPFLPQPASRILLLFGTTQGSNCFNPESWWFNSLKRNKLLLSLLLLQDHSGLFRSQGPQGVLSAQTPSLFANSGCALAEASRCCRPTDGRTSSIAGEAQGAHLMDEIDGGVWQVQSVLKVGKWRFPEIEVPPNHPF